MKLFKNAILGLCDPDIYRREFEQERAGNFTETL